MSNETMADVRDMYLIHAVFRRELRLTPGLVRGVPAGDVERARVVAEHIRFVDSFLDHHHHGEDEHLWPRLLDRGGQAAASVVSVMEQQHHAIGIMLADVREQVGAWQENADPERGEALARTVNTLLPLLVDHLAVEEQRALPLITEHITAAEWQRMVAEGAVGVDPHQQLLLFGMMMYEGDPDVIQDIIAAMPEEIRSNAAPAAAAAFAEYSTRVHGTDTPQRLGLC